MEIRLTNSFEKDYRGLSRAVRKAVDKKLLLLLESFRYPSLRTKKMEGYVGIWEARVSQGYRFTFTITDTVYIIRRVGLHNILKNP